MDIKGVQAAANTIRLLAMDGVEASGTGHPGMALGCAEIAATLYGEILKYNPEDPDWIDRDRFVLSAGHGSILLYAV
ncbi:MAG: transketolase, partial [Spirochaetota bacterium]